MIGLSTYSANCVQRNAYGNSPEGWLHNIQPRHEGQFPIFYTLVSSFVFKGICHFLSTEPGHQKRFNIHRQHNSFASSDALEWGSMIITNRVLATRLPSLTRSVHNVVGLHNSQVNVKYDAKNIEPELLKCKTSKEYIRYAKRAGLEVDRSRGKGGHILIRNNGKFLTLTKVGSNRQLENSVRKSLTNKFIELGVGLKPHNPPV